MRRRRRRGSRKKEQEKRKKRNRKGNYYQIRSYLDNVLCTTKLLGESVPFIAKEYVNEYKVGWTMQNKLVNMNIYKATQVTNTAKYMNIRLGGQCKTS